MKFVLHFIMIATFIISGASPLPACYVTRPDCKVRMTTSCPFMGGKHQTATAHIGCCQGNHSAKAQRPAKFPLEHLKRVTIDQMQVDSVDLPAFAPSLVTSVSYLPVPLSRATRLTKQLFSIHYHPPPLYLQHQTFII